MEGRRENKKRLHEDMLGLPECFAVFTELSLPVKRVTENQMK
jgi:hypothetical protein